VKILTIIVTFNAERWIEKCLNSLINSSIKPYIYIIDNNSIDNTLDIISKFKNDNLFINKNHKNVGFGSANNIGLKFAISKNVDYVLLLNQDTYIEYNTIQNLININHDFPFFGILSPMQYSPDNNLDTRFKHYLYNSKYFNDSILECKFVNAACWLIHNNVIKKIGGFSDLFYHYGEDLDYCNRVRFYGFKIGIVSNAKYIHDREQKLFLHYEKELHLETVNQISILSNIKHNLIIQIFIQFLYLIKTLVLNKYKFCLVLKSIINSYSSLFIIIRHRYKSKKNYAFL
jgi:GT2 family glycosyltransferase